MKLAGRPERDQGEPPHYRQRHAPQPDLLQGGRQTACGGTRQRIAREVQQDDQTAEVDQHAEQMPPEAEGEIAAGRWLAGHKLARRLHLRGNHRGGSQHAQKAHEGREEQRPVDALCQDRAGHALHQRDG